jgi:O-antigen/teichoic acid export membrane protein
VSTDTAAPAGTEAAPGAAPASATDRRAGSRIAMVLLGNVFPPAAAFITSPLLAQTLGADGRGTVSAATAPLLLMLGAATLGLPESVTFGIASGSSRRGTLLRAVGWSAAAGAVAAVLVLALSAPLSAGDPALQSLVAIAALAIAPGLVVGVVRGAAAGMGAWGLVTLDRIVQAVFRLGALVALGLLGVLTVEAATVVIAVGAVIGVLAYLPLLTHLHRAGGRAPLLSYGLRNWSGSLSGILVSRLDQSLMVPLSNPFQLGIYAVSVSISELPLVFNNAVRDVIFAAESERPDQDRLAQAARLSTALTAVAALGVGLLSVVFLVPLFGRDFSGAVGVTAVLLLAVVGGNPGSVAGMGLSARGRPGLRSLSLSLALIVDLVALVLLVPPLGAMGAAIATLLANCSSAALNLLWLRRCFRIPMRSFLSFRRSDLDGLVAVVRRRLNRSTAR